MEKKSLLRRLMRKNLRVPVQVTIILEEREASPKLPKTSISVDTKIKLIVHNIDKRILK